MGKRLKCPREGTRVRAVVNSASARLYPHGSVPVTGKTGTVTKMPGFRQTCLPGPGGGLVFVDWDNGSTFGVSRYDIVKEKSKTGLGLGLGHDPLHNEQVLKNYGKCLKKCKRKPNVGACIDACLGKQPIPGSGALGASGDWDICTKVCKEHPEVLKVARYPELYNEYMNACRDECIKKRQSFGGIPGRYEPHALGGRRRFYYGQDPMPSWAEADFTEADEGAKDKVTALANLREKLLQYARGLETMGVLTMYENAARRAGATSEEIQEQRAMVQRVLGEP